jgi:hypothetical protein
MGDAVDFLDMRTGLFRHGERITLTGRVYIVRIVD